MARHETVEVVLKTIEVDKGIAPVVQWLNTFSSCFTLYSCEGDKENEELKSTYVLFICYAPVDLQKIARAVGFLGTIEVSYHVEYNQMRYRLAFDKKERLEDFIEYIK